MKSNPEEPTEEIESPLEEGTSSFVHLILPTEKLKYVI